jgi:catechol 2,3-dioxygenase
MAVSDEFFRAVELSGLTLRVADLRRVASFYEETLGFRPLAAPNGRIRFSASGAEPALLVLESASEAPPRPRGAAGLYHVAFLYPDRAALGRVLGHLIRADVRLGAADHGVSEALYLSDPEGNGIELAADRPATLWPPAQPDGQVAMFTETLDTSSLVEAGRRSDGPLLPPETRIGHVHLSVSSLDGSEAFYGGELGFAVRQRDYPGARFFGRDLYHHHLATNTWQSRTPARPGALGLAHFTIRLASAEAWQAVVESARAGGHLERMDGSTAGLRDPDGIEVRVSRMEAR